jgi:hypothetical protein
LSPALAAAHNVAPDDEAPTMKRTSPWSFALVLGGLAPAAAQAAPTPAEAAAYTGALAAAWGGDVAAIARAPRLVLEVRDSHGRTPLPVATFGRRREAVRASSP